MRDGIISDCPICNSEEDNPFRFNIKCTALRVSIVFFLYVLANCHNVSPLSTEITSSSLDAGETSPVEAKVCMSVKPLKRMRKAKRKNKFLARRQLRLIKARCRVVRPDLKEAVLFVIEEAEAEPTVTHECTIKFTPNICSGVIVTRTYVLRQHFSEHLFCRTNVCTNSSSVL
jgi:hypothetical protein